MEKEDGFLSTLRQNLKFVVWNDRKDIGRPAPRCPVCGVLFLESLPSMHELFITRGMVRGCDKITQSLIYVPENVVLVHEDTCHELAQTHWTTKVTCSASLIRFCGYDSIKKWLDSMTEVMRTIDKQPYTLLEEGMNLYNVYQSNSK